MLDATQQYGFYPWTIKTWYSREFLCANFCHCEKYRIERSFYSSTVTKWTGSSDLRFHPKKIPTNYITLQESVESLWSGFQLSRKFSNNWRNEKMLPLCGRSPTDPFWLFPLISWFSFNRIYFSIYLLLWLAVPPGLPRLSEERNVVNVRQGSDKVLLEINIKIITTVYGTPFSSCHATFPPW